MTKWSAIAVLAGTVCGCNARPESGPTSVVLAATNLPTTRPAAATAAPKRVQLRPIATTRPTPDVKTLSFAASSIDLILAGQKTATIRRGNRDYPLGFAVATDRKRRVPITIVAVRHTKVGGLNAQDAAADHTQTVPAMMDALKVVYPVIKDADEVTVVTFKLTPPSTPR